MPAPPPSAAAHLTGTYASLTGTANVTVLPTVLPGNVTTIQGNSGRHIVYVPISLSAASSVPVPVYWHTQDGTATAGSVYVGVASSKVTIPAGKTVARIPVTTLGDKTIEPDEQFTIVLTAANWASIDKTTCLGYARLESTPRSGRTPGSPTFPRRCVVSSVRREI